MLNASGYSVVPILDARPSQPFPYSPSFRIPLQTYGGRNLASAVRTSALRYPLFRRSPAGAGLGAETVSRAETQLAKEGRRMAGTLGNETPSGKYRPPAETSDNL